MKQRLGSGGLVGIVALAIGFASPAARGSESLRQPVSVIAQAVTQVLERRGIDSLSVGDFTGPPTFGSSAGPGIRKLLIEEFEKRGIREKRIGAPMGIEGKYFLTKTTPAFAGAEAFPVLRIEASLVDASGQVLTDLNAQAEVKPFADDNETTEQIPISGGKVKVDVDSSDALAESLGATVDLRKPLADGTVEPGQIEDVVDSFTRPTAVIHDGVEVSASPASPFRMAILVDGQPRALTLEDGHPFVRLEKGESFQVRISNYAPFDTACLFSLDGVGSFSFSDLRHASGPKRGEPLYSKWIVPSRTSFVLKGWHRTNELVDKFLVTDFANSAASKLGSTSNMGTITATILATWKEGEDPPPGEPVQYRMVQDLGIGRGESDQQRVQEDRNRREYGTSPRAVITIRYMKPQ